MATIVIDHREAKAEPVVTGSPTQDAHQTVKPAAVKPSIAVNGVTIGHADIAREVQNHPAESPPQAWAEAARALIVRELLMQHAHQLAIEPQPGKEEEDRHETDEEALIRILLERELSVPEADEMSCRRYYDKNRDRFRSADLFEAAHILFPADLRDPPAFTKAVDSARAALELLSVQPDRFPDLARKLSACSSSVDGGHLGQFTRDQTTPEFAAALDRLASREITGTPVETPYGVHIIRLDRRIEGRTLPFDAVHQQIAAYLADSVWRRAAAQYISLLAGQATITGFDFEGADTPLVQ